MREAYDARKKVKRKRLVNAESMRKKWFEARDAKTPRRTRLHMARVEPLVPQAPIDIDRFDLVGMLAGCLSCLQQPFED